MEDSNKKTTEIISEFDEGGNMLFWLYYEGLRQTLVYDPNQIVINSIIDEMAKEVETAFQDEVYCAMKERFYVEESQD